MNHICRTLGLRAHNIICDEVLGHFTTRDATAAVIEIAISCLKKGNEGGAHIKVVSQAVQLRPGHSGRNIYCMRKSPGKDCPIFCE